MLIIKKNTHLGGPVRMDHMLPPDTSTLPVQGSVRLGTDKSKIHSLWDSDEKCSLLLFPYHAIDFKTILHTSRKLQSPEVETLKNIVLATTRPPQVT